MTKAYDNVADMSYDNLLASVSPPADVFSVVIRGGDEAQSLKRGTLLALSDADGKYVIFGTAAAEGEALQANAVLSGDVDVQAATDAPAYAYRTGHFVRGSLIAAEGAEITKTDEEDLRSKGILLSDAVTY